MDEITFFPYLRRGLARSLTTEDPLTGSVPRDPAFTAWIDVGGRVVEQAITLRGPGDAAALHPSQVMRREPVPNATAVEENYFTLVELRAPDLPWLLSPVAPAADGERLRPWLVLVTVREQDGVTLRPGTDGSLPVLALTRPAEELPDLADSWAWAHVQSVVPRRELDDAVADGASSVTARLICPRRLDPNSAYLACLVPAFEDGRLRGLGREVPDGAQTQPAWTDTTLNAPIELPVYDSWRFSTGPGGDFEALCRRLTPDGDGAELGMHALDITRPGIVPDADTTVIVDMRGALHTLEAHPRPWPTKTRQTFQAALSALLAAGTQRATYDPSVIDPVVAPPSYGSWPSGTTQLPMEGWLPELNLDPVNRAGAGLGARVVQENQEELVAAAWRQAGELRTTIDLLNRARLAVEATTSLTTRAATLDDADLLRLSSRLHPVLAGGATSVSARLATSAVPTGLVSQAVMRLTRPGTPLARDFAARAGRLRARVGAEHLATTLAATSPHADSTLAAALEFAVHGLPSGAQVVDPTLEINVSARFRTDAARTAGTAGTAGPDLPDTTPAPPGLPRPSTGSNDVSEIAATVRVRLESPSVISVVRAGLLERVPALIDLVAAGTLPTKVPLGPTFPDSLSPDLIALGAEWLLPGLSSLRPDRVRLVEVDATFVASFLVGANHELAGELLWRDYPVDLRATFFHRFWQYVDPERADIADISTRWKQTASLAANVDAEAQQLTAVVVRSDLVRRYPTAHWFLQKAVLDEDGALVPADDTVVEVSFLGLLDPQTAVIGFDLPSSVVRGTTAVTATSSASRSNRPGRASASTGPGRRTSAALPDRGTRSPGATSSPVRRSSTP